MRALILGLAIGVVACGGAQRSEGPDPRDNEITALWTQIRDWRREAGLQVEPDATAVLAMRRMSVTGAARACVRPPEPRAACDDVCDLADAICDNAESICQIASELGDDAWAREKCDSAKASCGEAQQRCCTCDRTPPGDGDSIDTGAAP